jgi:hypothetical protein
LCYGRLAAGNLAVQRTQYISITNKRSFVKLEFLEDISAGRGPSRVVSDNLVRLYHFTPEETAKLTALICKTLIETGEELNLAKVAFIKPMNCELVLTVTENEIGIVKHSGNFLTCGLTKESYQEMIEIMEHVGTGYNWLYEQSATDIDFLYSSGGTW